MFFSLTAVAAKSVPLCRKQAPQRFIFLMDWKLKRLQNVLRRLSLGTGLCDKETFLTSAENWD